MLAGYHHDHLLVPIDQADQAIAVLEALATRIVGDRRMAPFLRGPGADPKAAAAAQGTLEELVISVRQPDAVRTDEEGNAP